MRFSRQDHWLTILVTAVRMIDPHAFHTVLRNAIQMAVEDDTAAEDVLRDMRSILADVERQIALENVVAVMSKGDPDSVN